ncbi:hypothetical protein OSTOST_13486, partial [Ostertagia ostertagi]
PGRSAHQALAQCQANTRKYSWVIDVDIKGFFDNISHAILLEVLQKHTNEKWVLLYAERWLKAGVEQENRSIVSRTNGTPQGGVISPLFANLYLHYAFDKWMDENSPQCPFERYADDIVLHCSSKEEAEQLLEKLKARMGEYELELHPEKTKIVYCKNYEPTDDQKPTEYWNEVRGVHGRYKQSGKNADQKRWHLEFANDINDRGQIVATRERARNNDTIDKQIVEVPVDNLGDFGD